MNFVIEKITKSSGRLGQLVHIETGRKFPTPLLLQTTKAGSIPCLSKEVFNYVTKELQVLQMSLATMDQMAESVDVFNKGLSAYVGYKDYPNVMLIRDPCALMPQGYNDMFLVPLYTRRGKESISADRYMEAMERFKPDIYQGLSDADTNLDSSKKRIIKSIDRTAKLMEACYEKHSKSQALKKSALFAPIIGGYNNNFRSKSINHAKTKGKDLYSGYVLEGFHHYGLSACDLDKNELLKVLEHCVKEMEEEKPKLMPGAYTPILILEMVKLGIDIFDTSYACLAASNYRVLSFEFELKSKDSNRSVTRPFLDITDDELSEDFTPFIEGCCCLACLKHTRAYVHHLYKTHELLGPILIMIHNLHHYMQYFEAIRKAVDSDTLEDLIKLIKYQNQDEEIDYCIPENNKKITKASISKDLMEN